MKSRQDVGILRAKHPRIRQDFRFGLPRIRLPRPGPKPPTPFALARGHSQNVLEVDSWINQHFPTQCNILPMSAGDEGMEASMPCIC